MAIVKYNGVTTSVYVTVPSPSERHHEIPSPNWTQTVFWGRFHLWLCVKESCGFDVFQNGWGGKPSSQPSGTGPWLVSSYTAGLSMWSLTLKFWVFPPTLFFCENPDWFWTYYVARDVFAHLILPPLPTDDWYHRHTSPHQARFWVLHFPQQPPLEVLSWLSPVLFIISLRLMLSLPSPQISTKCVCFSKTRTTRHGSTHLKSQRLGDWDRRIALSLKPAWVTE